MSIAPDFMTTKTDLTTRCHKGRQGKKPVFIGIHTMEAPETSQTAENVARYFKTVNASAHQNVDDDSRVRSVNDEDTAWTLPGANSISLNIEIAGYARQTAADWADEFSLRALDIAAYTAAEWCIKYGIPVRKLTDAQIRNKEKGFVGHVDANRVFKQSSHWDPGPHFPWEYFLKRVNYFRKGLLNEDVSKEEPRQTSSYDNKGYTTGYVKAAQQKLKKLGYDIVADGLRGSATAAATKDFQKKNDLVVDGIPGPTTVAKMDAKLAKKPAVKGGADIKPLQRAVKADADNIWGPDTDKRVNAVIQASNLKGVKHPHGVKFTQRVVGANDDGIWGTNSKKQHDKTVVKIKKALLTAGYSVGTIDGTVNSKLVNSLKTIESKANKP